MTDDIHNKVVSIFQKHRRGDNFHFQVDEEGEMVITPDGFNYVTLKHSKDHGRHNEGSLFEIGDQKNYIFKFVEPHDNDIRIDNYYVTGDRLMEFLGSLDKRPGRLVEIKQFLPEHLA